MNYLKINIWRESPSLKVTKVFYDFYKIYIIKASIQSENQEAIALLFRTYFHFQKSYSQLH